MWGGVVGPEEPDPVVRPEGCVGAWPSSDATEAETGTGASSVTGEGVGECRPERWGIKLRSAAR